ncbi:hypothetical protein HN51_062040 [Arachis hypogaea]|uniref:EPIDERMAL PATTERNING FACTOR-like protein 2 n=1 Tax=Arachis ipaensis TaxID=130454 RepID=UPI0007AFBFB8|nr:EPIDERMAL PATTERNING FACTOR-like protein 2 [Arachis ipaensis]XP_025631012.1 EPIDERMAL PATTERNING FACTOR-like protein 2 [Arachis hypogaea]QHO19540.1 EPIDERMAL PATTERNING FACTOR-like protein [Arachis hypogaea]
MGLDHHAICGLRRLGFIIFSISLFFFIISSWIHHGLVTEGRKTHKQSGFHQGVIEEDNKILRAQIGSKPPKCERRCSSCGHCKAIQVPTNTNLQIQKGNINPPKLFKIAYARGDDKSNYKPMSWKCKCGNLIFNP